MPLAFFFLSLAYYFCKKHSICVYFFIFFVLFGFAFEFLLMFCLQGAMDYQVQLHESPFGELTTTVYDTHSDRVKDVEVEPNGSRDLWWSASSDGTVRQFDKRLPHAGCSTSRKVGTPLPNHHRMASINKNVLVLVGPTDFPYNHHFHWKKAMGLAISPTNHNMMAVACGDNIVRLYDRRKLALKYKTTDFSPSVATYGPPHDKMNSMNPNHHMQATHVSFSPDGKSLIASFHSDHVYSFDVYSSYGVYNEFEQKESKPVTPYELPFESCEWGFQSRYVEEKKIREDDLLDEEAFGSIEECSKKIEEAHRAFNSSLFDANNDTPLYGARYMTDLYCKRADFLSERNWTGDCFLAMLDCARARGFSSDNLKSSLMMVELLNKAGQKQKCSEEALKLSRRFPDASEKVSKYIQNTNVEENEQSTNSQMDTSRDSHAVSRNPTSTQVVFTVEGRRGSMLASIRSRDQSLSGNIRQQSEESAGDGARRPTFTVSRQNEASGGESSSQHDDESAESGTNSNEFVNSELLLSEQENLAKVWKCIIENSGKGEKEHHHFDSSHFNLFNERYIGARNVATDVKESAFFGRNHVVAGSDDGRVFIWEKRGAKLVHILEADEDVVNCVKPHPFFPVLASSGIDSTIKIWAPLDKKSLSVDERSPELAQIQKHNQASSERTSWQLFNRAIMRQVLDTMAGNEGGANRMDVDEDSENNQIECIQS
mmetsp:Transcript_7028/g.10515  ORF Transcript_7028/g.10515 Transcript_7028/m.10515 type:complete len:713 (+) Transcript_7028:526-2664(+)